MVSCFYPSTSGGGGSLQLGLTLIFWALNLILFGHFWTLSRTICIFFICIFTVCICVCGNTVDCPALGRVLFAKESHAITDK